MSEVTQKNRKKRVGTVVSNKMEKTIAVDVQRVVKHPIYGKSMKVNKKFLAHDEKNECNIGDTVEIVESRPLSKRKKWSLTQIIQRAK